MDRARRSLFLRLPLELRQPILADVMESIIIVEAGYLGEAKRFNDTHVQNQIKAVIETLCESPSDLIAPLIVVRKSLGIRIKELQDLQKGMLSKAKRDNWGGMPMIKCTCHCSTRFEVLAAYSVLKPLCLCGDDWHLTKVNEELLRFMVPVTEHFINKCWTMSLTVSTEDALQKTKWTSFRPATPWRKLFDETHRISSTCATSLYGPMRIKIR